MRPLLWHTVSCHHLRARALDRHHLLVRERQEWIRRIFDADHVSGQRLYCSLKTYSKGHPRGGGVFAGTQSGDCVGNSHAVDWRPHPPCIPRFPASLNNLGLRLICRTGATDSMGQARQTARVPSRLATTPVSPEGIQRAMRSAVAIPHRG